MGTMGFYFFDDTCFVVVFVLDALWWYGMVCVGGLMEESQGIEDQDKERIVGWVAMGFQQAFNEGEISFQEAYINNVLTGVRGNKGNFCY